uniref:uncharacterized protein LOC129510432 n=1 Tax=Nyctereutes procyonoides TaxID=34880 RepID=UPI002444E518|nr:uncharacterized protein LOC129510432 [Nyctereutes procyonoides]
MWPPPAPYFNTAMFLTSGNPSCLPSHSGAAWQAASHWSQSAASLQGKPGPQADSRSAERLVPCGRKQIFLSSRGHWLLHSLLKMSVVYRPPWSCREDALPSRKPQLEALTHGGTAGERCERPLQPPRYHVPGATLLRLDGREPPSKDVPGAPAFISSPSTSPRCLLGGPGPQGPSLATAAPEARKMHSTGICKQRASQVVTSLLWHVATPNTWRNRVALLQEALLACLPA